MLEKWDCHRMDYNSQNGYHNHPPRNQSFSSALLDAICKSTEAEGGMMTYKTSRSRVEIRNVEAKNNTPMRNSRMGTQQDNDSWTNREKFMLGRSAKMGVFNSEKIEAESVYRKHRESHLPNMSPGAMRSSEYAGNTSSISCPYLNSDSESVCTPTSSSRTAKTEGNSHHMGREESAWKLAVGDRDLHGKALIRDGYFRSTEKPFIPADHHAKIKSKSKTVEDSKKPNQPISPGRKLANFFNSLFSPGYTKKPKLSLSSSVSDPNSYDSSVYSSSSSILSRPCLSKKSSGSNNSSGMSQKSVTSYPTIVTVDKAYSRPSGEKCLYRIQNPAPNPNSRSYPHTHPFKVAYKLPLLEKDNHAADVVAAKDIIGKYQKVKAITKAEVRVLDQQEEEEEEDVASCSSSDLFELENLEDIDMNVHQKELPVYGTTHWETNKAIAKGLIV